MPSPIEVKLAAVAAVYVSQVLDNALRQAAELIKRDAQRRIHSRTGRLSKTMAIKKLRPKRGRIGYSVNTGTRSELGLRNPHFYFPAHLEYGHAAPYRGRLARARGRQRERMSRRGGRRTPAHSFLGAALRQNRAQALRLITTAILA